MIIQEVVEIDHRVLDSDPLKLKENIDLAKDRIIRMLTQHITVEVENRIKDGNAIKKIIVTFEP